MNSSERGEQDRIDTLCPNRAIVMGASMAGLLAARVLSERFDEVLLIERDALPDWPALRKGTPHAGHAHGLLVRGREVLEELFPGFTESLQRRGGFVGDMQRNLAFLAGGRRFASGIGGRMGVCASRPVIEDEVRRRVKALPNVRLCDRIDVVEPVFDSARQAVAGVRVRVRGSKAADTEAAVVHLDPAHGMRVPDDAETWLADLVVDATGRGSRTPRWLEKWGFASAPEERICVNVQYATAYYERKDDDERDLAGAISSATPDHPWPGVLLAQEPVDTVSSPKRWVVTLAGYAADRPPEDALGMHHRAIVTGADEIIRVTQRARMLGGVTRFGFPHSQRRLYEKLNRFPGGYLVVGDAIASFNPIYGQGMTVAACEALELRQALKKSRTNLHRRFFAACARVIDTPWRIAAGSDLAIPGVFGDESFSTRIVNRYLHRLFHAAQYDSTVALAFVRVVQMIASPASLFQPATMSRVLWQSVSRPRARTSHHDRNALSHDRERQAA